MLIIQNESLLDLIKSNYTLQDIRELSVFLNQNKVFQFSALDNGLFPAAKTVQENQYTGYYNAWVRDNIHVAHAFYVLEKKEIARKNVLALMAYFKKYRTRFDHIIVGKSNAKNPMHRPHIRFNGSELEEIEQKWAHAQNDALGYFLWFYCKLAEEGVLQPESDDIEILTLFPKYWQTIRYWEDEDSGHWEETPKISASSIGVVVAALKRLKFYLTDGGHGRDRSNILLLLDDLIDQGTATLEQILPHECIQSNAKQYRRYDAALLFLIYPLQVVTGDMADTILADVIDNLQGDYGIRRYLGDSYWCADYKQKFVPKSRTIDYSNYLSKRDSLLKKGEEAQWCIFDPIISIIFGLKFQRTGNNDYLAQQVLHFNRSLGQISGKDCGFGTFQCPESYYLKDGRYMANDITPLYWTQANLACALIIMEQCLMH